MARVGLGCMRFSTDEDRDEERALSAITAALGAGATWFDTARVYGSGADELGHNERLLARAIGASPNVRVVTKCGMARPGGRWEPDGRASAILASARASTADLGRPPDLLLLHAPDPRMPLATSVRALVRAKERGLALAVGLSNVNRRQLETLGGVDIAAVQVSLGAFDDAPARGGLIAWCKERGIAVQAHSPLGGPKRARRLAFDTVLRAVASRHGVTPAEIVLAYLLAVSENIVPIVGARRPETAAGAIAASNIVLDERDLDELDARFPGLAMARRPMRPISPSTANAEVVIVMGVAGSGKTRLAQAYVERGYERLNRDTVGGTLAGIARRLEERLAAGARRIVLDNTYITRTARSEVVRVASASGATVACIHVDTPAHETHVNLTTRMLDRHGELLGGAALKTCAKNDPGLFTPNVVARMHRELEPPSEDEGFAFVEIAPFVREHSDGHGGIALPIELLVASSAGQRELASNARAEALLSRLSPSAPILLFGWLPDADDAFRERAFELAGAVISDRVVEIGLCAHGAGPPECWCRPPLPGLWLAFARRHRIDPRRSAFVTTTRAHETMARALGIATITASGNHS